MVTFERGNICVLCLVTRENILSVDELCIVRLSVYSFPVGGVILLV